MELIKLNHLQIDLAAFKLLTVSNLTINSKQRIGLIGDNGVGKTTLMKVLAQRKYTDPFSITGIIKRNCSVAYVPQLLDAGDKSGGQREKLVLSKAVAQLKDRPNGLLLLDEPTSNLDIDQQKWLINLLQKSKLTCLIISHDQNFLKQICNSIWYVQDKQVRSFTGTFPEFQSFRQNELKRNKISFEQKRKHIDHLKASYNQRYNKARSFSHNKKGLSSSDWRSQSLGKQKNANKVVKVSKNIANRIAKEKAGLKKPQTRQSITLKNGIAQKGPLAFSPQSKALRLDPQEVKAFGQTLFTIKSEVNLDYQTKVVLTGQNGVGKSVFLKKIKEEQLSGFYGPKLKMGYFDQNIVTKQTSATILYSLTQTSMFDNSSTMQILGDLHLQKFCKQKINSLSGGQLVCYNLAKIITGQYNFLLLDEPTNFLDIDSVNALAEFVTSYPFAMILVTHDQAFIDQLKAKRWQITGGFLQTSAAQITKSRKSNANQLELLKFRLDQMMLDPQASIAEIKQLKEQIIKLQK